MLPGPANIGPSFLMIRFLNGHSPIPGWSFLTADWRSTKVWTVQDILEDIKFIAPDFTREKVHQRSILFWKELDKRHWSDVFLGQTAQWVAFQRKNQKNHFSEFTRAIDMWDEWKESKNTEEKDRSDSNLIFINDAIIACNHGIAMMRSSKEPLSWSR